MKFLNGRELVGFIKERQAKQVRSLRQSEKIFPKLAIINTSDNKGSAIYTKLKKKYGEDILIDVDIYEIEQSKAVETINTLNVDKTVHGIIVQLPLDDNSQQDEILNAVDPGKDVDGLGVKPHFDPATPLAITWLLDGFDVSLQDMKIVIVGKGKLVGAPLANMWANHDLTVVDSQSNLSEEVIKADIVVTATGKPNLITSALLKQKAVVVDAGVAEAEGTIKGDLADDVYERDDLTVTPRKGGVGPLTVCALFGNVIKASHE